MAKRKSNPEPAEPAEMVLCFAIRQRYDGLGMEVFEFLVPLPTLEALMESDEYAKLHAGLPRSLALGNLDRRLHARLNGRP